LPSVFTSSLTPFFFYRLFLNLLTERGESVAGKGKQCRVSSILTVDSIPWVGPGNNLVFGEAGNDSVTDVYGPFFGFPVDRDLLFGGHNNDF
jgi:hypothetical protein